MCCDVILGTCFMLIQRATEVTWWQLNSRFSMAHPSGLPRLLLQVTRVAVVVCLNIKAAKLATNCNNAVIFNFSEFFYYYLQPGKCNNNCFQAGLVYVRNSLYIEEIDYFHNTPCWPLTVPLNSEYDFLVQPNSWQEFAKSLSCQVLFPTRIVETS